MDKVLSVIAAATFVYTFVTFARPIQYHNLWWDTKIKERELKLLQTENAIITTNRKPVIQSNRTK